MAGNLRNKTILTYSNDNTWEKPTFKRYQLKNGIPGFKALETLQIVQACDDDIGHHLLWLSSLTTEVSPLVQEVSSSAPFSKVYKLNNSLKSFTLNLVVVPDSTFIKSLFSFLQSCGSVAVKNNQAIGVTAADFKFYGWVMSKGLVINPQSTGAVTFSVTILGFEYGD